MILRAFILTLAYLLFAKWDYITYAMDGNIDNKDNQITSTISNNNANSSYSIKGENAISIFNISNDVLQQEFQYEFFPEKDNDLESLISAL